MKYLPKLRSRYAALLTLLALVVALCSILTGCGGSSNANSSLTDTGASGAAQVVSQKSGQPPAAPAPLAGLTILIKPQDSNQVIASTVTDSQGNFAVNLPAGNYTAVPVLSAAQSSSGIAAQSVNFTVTPNKITTVTLQLSQTLPS